MRATLMLTTSFLAWSLACTAPPAPKDAGPKDDAGPDQELCELGASATGTVGPRGGRVALCGAALELQPDQIADDVDVRIEIVEPPAPPPPGYELNGLAFHFTTTPHGAIQNSGIPGMSARFAVTLPVGDTDRLVMLSSHSGSIGWFTYLYCEAEAPDGSDVLLQSVVVEETFVVLQEERAYPTTTVGLGGGSVATTLDGVDTTWDLDVEQGATHGMREVYADGTEVVTLAALQDNGAGDSERLLLKLSRAVGDVWAVLEVHVGEVLHPDGFWSYLLIDVDRSVDVDATLSTDGAFTGELHVELARGDVIEMLDATFDAVVEDFRYPPSMECPAL